MVSSINSCQWPLHVFMLLRYSYELCKTFNVLHFHGILYPRFGANWKPWSYTNSHKVLSSWCYLIVFLDVEYQERWIVVRIFFKKMSNATDRIYIRCWVLTTCAWRSLTMPFSWMNEYMLETTEVLCYRCFWNSLPN